VGIATVDKTANRIPGATAFADARHVARKCRAGLVASGADVGWYHRAGLTGSCLLALVMLAACAATGSKTVAPIPATAETVSPQCPAWVTPCVGAPAKPVVGDVGDLPRLVQTADDLLFAGDEKAAWQQLNEALKIDPKHRPALWLMSQISDDPRKLLGDMSEPYTVGKGESLRQIAAARLGDARLFYALARFNNIQVPRQLEAGRSILLPLPATGAGPAKAPAGKRTAASGADAGAASNTAGAPPPAPAVRATTTTAAPTLPLASGAAAPGPAASATDTATRAGTSTTASIAVRAVAPAAALGDTTAVAAGSTTRTTGAAVPATSGGDGDLAFRRAAAAEKAGKTEQAYAGFMRALALGHSGAAERAGALRQELIAQQKRVARTALERQNLDVAIKALRTVLELDPGDSAADADLRKAQRRRDALIKR
jgi:tetratricopeptide (TPR) repeat protein